MPQTPVFGLPFEDEADQPGITLTGGEFGTEDILAEAVEAALLGVRSDVQTNAADIATLDTRVTALEGLSPGWTYITHGQTTSVTTQDIDITDGGRFPDGFFQMVRMTLRFDLDAAGYVFARINNVADGAYNNGGYGFDCDGNMEVLVFGGVSNNSFRIGYGSTVATNNVIAQFMHTHISAAVNYQSFSGRMSGSAGSHVGANFWGNRSAAVGPTTSMQLIAADGATQFAQLWWWVEGFWVPA